MAYITGVTWPYVVRVSRDLADDMMSHRLFSCFLPNKRESIYRSKIHREVSRLVLPYLSLLHHHSGATHKLISLTVRKL